MFDEGRSNTPHSPQGRKGLELPHGYLHLPVFLPDATRGVVRAMDGADMLRCGIQGLQMNVFHLMQKPGSSTIKALGGLHTLFGWRRPIVTDSGGFQVYSLVRQNPKYGQLTEKGMLFRPDGSRRINLTPEKSIQLQVSYGADVIICLDDCTHADEPPDAQLEAVERTVKWAGRCKAEFQRQVEERQLAPDSKPLLLAVVQGGTDRDLRKRCATELLEIGFDGFGLGGWPLDSAGNLLSEIIAYVRELIPPAVPLHALGIGQPDSVVTCARMGYDLFDSTMPTRDARRGRLYLFTSDPASSRLLGDWYTYLYVADSKHIRADTPISPYCDCLCCSDYSLAYLHHLFKLNDPSFYRLATMHNLRFMMQLMARLRALATA